MFLQKLEYHDGTGIAMPNASKRIEFLVHYWQYVFSKQNFRLEDEWLKSHRGLLQRVKLQIETNYESGTGIRKKVKTFFVDEKYFDSNDPIIKSLPRVKKADIIDLQGILSKRFNQVGHADHVAASDILKKLDKVITYFEGNYARKLKKQLLSQLSSNAPINDSIISELRVLVNCLIVELLLKGFTEKYLKDLVFKIQNIDDFPYDRLRGDFNTDQEFQTYKEGIFGNLTIKDQLNGIINLLGHEERAFEVIFKVYGLNWSLEPLEILDVTFYNPNRNNKIIPVQFFNEDFTISGNDEQKSNSYCNAYVEVKGIQEPMIIDRAYNKVAAALSILNAQIEKSPFIRRDKALISVKDRVPKVLFGSFSAVNDAELINRIPDYKKDDIAYINNLNWSVEKDQDLIRLISEISALMQSDSKYTILDIYSNLEGYFGKADFLKTLFFNCFKIWADNHYFVSVKLLLRNFAVSSGVRPEVHEEYKLSSSQVSSFGFVITPGSVINFRKFSNKLNHANNAIDTPFWNWVISDALEYRNNKTNWHDKIKARIEYYIDELNTERNLIVHSRQTEHYTRMRREEFFNFILIILRVYTSYHMSYSIRRTVSHVADKIQIKANTI